MKSMQLLQQEKSPTAQCIILQQVKTIPGQLKTRDLLMQEHILFM